MATLPDLVRNSLFLALGTAFSKGLVLLSYLVLTRSLGPEEFGRYSLIFAYLAFFELLADCGLDALTVRDVARAPHARESRSRLGDALILRLALAAAAIPLAALLFPALTNQEGGLLLVGVGGLTLLTSNRRASLRTLLEVPFRVDLRMGWPTFLSAAAEAAHLGVLVWMIERWGLYGAVGAQSLTPIPFLLLLAVLSFRRMTPQFDTDLERLLGRLVAAAPLLGVLLLNVVLARIDVLMLERMRGATEVGLYAAPTRVTEVASLLPILLMTSVVPLFARHTDEPSLVDRLFRASLRLLTVALLPIAALEIAYAGPLVSLLFGADFAGSADVLPWLALAEILIFADIVIGARLVATGEERSNLILVGLAAATNVAANLWLIPRFGAAGAAQATTLAYLVRVLAGAALPATLGVTGQALRAQLPAVLAGALAFGPAIFLEAHRLAWFVGGIAAYPVALYLLGAARPAEALRLVKAVRSAVPGVPGSVGNGRRDG